MAPAYVLGSILEAFNAGITINSSCFTCPFACEKRCSDITIGDFWGIGSESPFHKPNRKVSVIGVNSKRGFDFLNECKSLVLEKEIGVKLLLVIHSFEHLYLKVLNTICFGENIINME